MVELLKSKPINISAPPLSFCSFQFSSVQTVILLYVSDEGITITGPSK